MIKNRILLSIFLALGGFISLSAQSSVISGKASYYSNSLHGRKMSNGERYNRNDFTCAHRSLPFGTKLKVTNTKNGKSVVVRVTDRGPFHRSRVVDLSYAAAKEIGMVASGVGYIKVEVLPKTTEVPYVAEPSTIKMPEIEYGFAGVCYEFIPEWKEQGKTTEPKKIERKAAKPENEKKETNELLPSPRLEGKHPKSVQTPIASDKKVESSKKTSQEKREDKKTGDSKTWTNFFTRIKDGVGSLFE
ncbi:MAG: septal ring lytic transglycosylase RlpA family protein [Prevotella sp.]|nr:septal ring lytic transglycosylase RlpA family protein [Prevotellaceae bacterium]MDY3935757.1 septal ring lytic transglycosylase RlpA family protein [Prevotella sp.]